MLQTNLLYEIVSRSYSNRHFDDVPATYMPENKKNPKWNCMSSKKDKEP